MRFKKSVSLILLIILLFQIFSLPAPASFAEPDEESSAPEASRVGVVEELRGADSDTYLLSDGTYECVIYSEDKYFMDEQGEYSEIDDSIVSVDYSRAGLTYRYANAANSTKVYFSDMDTPAILVDANGKRLAFSLPNANSVQAVAGQKYGKEEIAGYFLRGDNYIAYPNLYDGADFIYAVTKDCLKEYIVLNNAGAPLVYSFSFAASGYSAEATGEGTIRFLDNDGNCVFELGKLFAVDSAGAYTEALEYSVISSDPSLTTISISISEDYVNAPDRVFPILVDPSVMITGSSKTQDSYVSSRYPSNNYYLNDYLRTGWDSNYYIRRTYIRFNIPASIPSGSVSSAYMRLEKHSGNTPSVKAYRVTSSWSSSSINWSNKPGYSSSSASAAAVIDTGNWYRMDVSSTVKDWVNGKYGNYGFVVMGTGDEETSQWTTFYSSDADSPHKPELHIVYSDPIVLDRIYFTYFDTKFYRNKLQYRMNCYGYALHVYSLSGTEQDPYKQQPGEFARDDQTFLELFIEQYNIMNNHSLSANTVLNYLEGKMYADFASLSEYYGSEWTITRTTQTAAVPAGYRKIALTIGIGKDYHFYVRHSDGMWSHKQGSDQVSNRSIDSNVIITDDNIASVVKEDGYTDGVRYYLIGKSAVIDYPHSYGQYPSSLYTAPQFCDCAGAKLAASAEISGTMKSARFDYVGDIDCYAFVPETSGTYIFTTSLTSSKYDVNMTIYDAYGNIVAVDNTAGNPSLSVALTSGKRYFIRVNEANGHALPYTLYYNKE